jgi:nifR3 family TIM-barrel protein
LPAAEIGKSGRFAGAGGGDALKYLTTKDTKGTKILMMKIGNLDIMYNAVPAPLASLTDIAFRKLLDEIGFCGFMVTEMISAEGLRRQQSKTLAMIRPGDFKTPQFIQLFGPEPEPFIDAVKYVENETEFQGIDINMGCPATKVIKKGGGAALLKAPMQVAAIVREVKKSTKLPVTVKIRLGYNRDNVFEIVRILEEEGADAIAVHFRLRADGYSGIARWEIAPMIRDILKKETVFIGNGDIKTVEEAREKMDIVDGVMIGRGAVTDPLIFARIAGEAEHLTMKWVYKRLLELIEEHYEPHLRLARVKAYTRFLFSNRKYSKPIRQKIYTSKSYEEAKDTLHSMMVEEYFDIPRTDV